MRVTVIVTVLNEAVSLPELLESLEQQSRAPDEVVIVDGGSADGSWALLQSYEGTLPLRVLQLPGSTIAQGRNAAIEAASGEIIAATDAGVRLAPRWLEELLRPFLEQPDTQVAAGFFQAAPRSLFELVLGATTLPRVEEVRPESFLPSSRSVAFTKSAWEKGGGYPAWLDYGEDLVFAMRLRQLDMQFAWAPKAIVFYRPRTSLKDFFLQYYRYARGDGKARLWLPRHLGRYSAYCLGAALLLLGASAPFLWALLAMGGGGYLCHSYRRLLPWLGELSILERLAALALAPLLRVTGDVAKMLGYAVGLWWRWRRGAALKDQRSAPHG